MADTANTELKRQGGYVPFHLGQLLTSADLQRAQTLGLATLHHWLLLFGYDGNNDTPLSGFPDDSDHCLASMTGDLAGSVAPGIGYFFDSSALDPAGDAWNHNAYRPIVVDAAEAFTLAAHDATNPRWDIISLAPAWEEDESDTRRVKNPTTLVESSQSVPLRKRYYFQLTVTTGTPGASPAEPSVPAGHIKIARAEVPPTSGAAVLRDTRPLWQLGSLFKGHPAKEYAKNYIPNPTTAPNALQVTASSPTSLVLQVAEGRAVIRGIARWYAKQTVTITAADPTNPRIDLVCAREDGTVTVTAGTPAATPAAPAQPSNSIALAQVAVAALDTTIAAGDITDLRSTRVVSGQPLALNAGVRRPYGAEQFDDGAIPHSKLSVPEVYFDLAAPSVVSDLCTIAVSLYYPDGNTAYGGPFGQNATAFKVELFRIPPGSAVFTGGDFPAADADFTTTNYASPWILCQETEILLWWKPTTGTPEGAILDATANGGATTSGTLLAWTNEATGTLKIERAAASGHTGDFAVVVTPLNRPGGARVRIFSFT